MYVWLYLTCAGAIMHLMYFSHTEDVVNGKSETPDHFKKYGGTMYWLQCDSADSGRYYARVV
jgi:hypothetical protein